MKSSRLIQSLTLISVLGLSACEDHRDSPNAPFPERIDFVAERQYPEGIAYSSQLSKFLITSIPLGKIGTVSTDGKYEDLINAPELISGIGMKVAGNYAFVCNSDRGISVKSTTAGAFQTAELLVFNLTTRQLERRTNLASLIPAEQRNFANDVTLAPDGTAFVTDSFSPVIYRVSPDGIASVLARDEVNFTSPGFGLNGIVYHPDGYLIVANTGQGKLFKVDLQNGNQVSEIIGTGALPGDGLTLLDGDLYVVTGGARVAQLRSSDNWKTASILKFDEVGYLGATTSVAVNNQIYTLNARIGTIGDARDFSIQRFR
ncbi:SMP-30/gluconolactonase/LRE family protein [Dyadobacter sp. CY345]|uniref:SMP-30/gluconolactonase/LRE family protein n=1 Tax=Dyadobacter sp. CY345 TaxID=2909335 RepID=UPI001F15D9BF|nr:SMP-30/gluconolactonase/LRE family protein [Dyadobacter sp. CY345]MCF2447100.1 SMP-30/gluconolactonase/LRE family protein [Dyadobacter sp. CY345]